MVVVSRSISIGEGFLAGSSMILEIEASVDRLENIFSKCFL